MVYIVVDIYVYGRIQTMTHDMTKGSILSLLVRFTLPLVAGNILQLTYNAVDSIILGRFVGSHQLAAVGTSNPLMTLILMCMQGISLGCGVLIGQLFGNGDIKKLQRQVSTGMMFGVVFALAISLMINIGASSLLHLIQVNELILPHAITYLRIVGCGLIFSFLYNYLSSVLRSLGDSVTPLFFLALSSVLNIAGDLLFVIVLHMGIAGCAISTVLCEGLSCGLAFLYIIKKIPFLNMGRKWLVFDRAMIKKTLQYSSVTAIQQSTVQAGILGVQAVVNTMGAAATAGFAVANRIDDYSLIPGRNIANAMTNVLAQNVGAGNKERVRKTFIIGMALEITFGIIASVLLFLVYDICLKLFTEEAIVLEEGRTYLRLIALMYVLPAVTNGIQGYFRGTGKLKITLISSILNMGMRFISCMILVFIFHMGIEAVPWSCFIGWTSMLVIEVPLLLREQKKLMSKFTQE